MTAMSKTILANVDGFTPVIDAVVLDVGLLTATIFGKVWRYCQMSDGACSASQDRIAQELGLSRATINSHIDKLVGEGYLKDTTPEIIGSPHVYADTGKANLSISFTGSIQPPVKQIDTKKVLKKEKERLGAQGAPDPSGIPEPKPTPPATWDPAWQMAAGVTHIQVPAQDELVEAALANAVNLFYEHEQPYIIAFYRETGILPLRDDLAYWRKALTYQKAKGVTPEELTFAARQALKDDMSVSSPKSLEKYAVDIHARAARNPEGNPGRTETDLTQHLRTFVPRGQNA
jgi:DNA-binding Lrp family transcriptional regulator